MLADLEQHAELSDIVTERRMHDPPRTGARLMITGAPHDHRPGGCDETSLSIEEIGPTTVFDAAFDGEQRIGNRFDQRRLALLNPKNGMHSQWFGVSTLSFMNSGSIQIRLGRSDR